MSKFKYLLLLAFYMAGLQARAREWVARANKFIAKFRKSLTKKHYFFAIFLIVLLILLKDIKAVVVITVLGLLASYSTIYKRALRIPSAIELMTFGTVITGIAYGPTAGMVFGFVTNLAAEIISSGMDIFTFLYIFVRAFIGFLAWHLYWTYNLDVVTVGIISSCIFTFITAPFYMLPGDFEAKLKVIFFFFVSLGMNFVIFTILGNLVLKIVLP
jgi:hypothetical protein